MRAHTNASEPKAIECLGDDPQVIRLPMGIWCVRYERMDDDGTILFSAVAYGNSRSEAIHEFNKGYARHE